MSIVSTQDTDTSVQSALSDQSIAGFSVVIPAYNEEHAIGPVLTQMTEILEQSPWPYELVIIDDGSQDATGTVVQQHPQIRLITHPANKGYGASLKTGIRHAHYDIICITDADGTYPNERLFDLLERLLANSSDMVVGARTGEAVAIPLARRPAKWAVRQLASFVSGQHIPDINSGFRAFRRDTVLPFWNILPNGFSFTTTITLCLLTNAYLVEYLPINYHQRVGASKIKPIRDTLKFVSLTLRIGLYFAPLKIFIPISVLLLVLAVMWGVFSSVVFGRLADVSTIVIAMAGVQVLVLGLVAELINYRFPSLYRRPEGD